LQEEKDGLSVVTLLNYYNDENFPNIGKNAKIVSVVVLYKKLLTITLDYDNIYITLKIF